MKLARLFHNTFLERPVSHAELMACATDAKECLRASNEGGAFDPVVAALTAAIAQVNATAVGNGVTLGRRKGAKHTKRNFRRALPAKAGQIHACVVSHYGPKAPELRRVFPRGRLGLIRTTDDGLGPALGAMQAALAALAPDMGPAGVTAEALALELVTGWAEVYARSEQSSAAKAFAESEHRAARQALGIQLHLALLTVTTHFTAAAAAEGKLLSKKEAAEITARYFRQDLLKDRTRRK